MRVINFSVILIITLILGSPVVHADKTLKIGVVDFEHILKTSAAGKSFQDQINKKRQVLNSELGRVQKEFSEFQDRIKREAPLLDNDQKAQIQQELNVKVNEFRMLQDRMRKEFRTHRAELMQDIKKGVVRVSTKLGEKKGYALIIEKQSGTVLYAKDSFDITRELLGDYDREFMGKKKPK
jgi:outer membrane protein